jgi:hypothetical protein
MGHLLNVTDEYYLQEKDSLNWELTVCNALYPEDSPCRKALQTNASFGFQLFRFLEKRIPIKEVKSILEVGGGFGYLMSEFLALCPDCTATMLDISPHLLKKQQQVLAGLDVRFIQQDILNTEISDLQSYDLAILNENIGDLPTLVSSLQDAEARDLQTRYYLDRVDYLNNRYGLTISTQENINIGALTVLDNLCLAGIKYIYLSEHSCESLPPDSVGPYLHFEPTRIPERISLRKHNEYTIKFSYLQKLAQAHGYQVLRGQYVDVLPLKWTDEIRTALCLPRPLNAEQEIIQQFIYDIFKYEYMVAIKDE